MKLFVRPIRAIALLLSAFFLSFFNVAAHAEEFLDPQVAFKFSARAIDANTLEARWQIADRYYMYRDKFKFAVEGATLGTPKLPPGKMKEDETFGNVEVYRKEVRITLPIQRTSNVSSVTLTATSQGCADAGLCYTPITETKRIALPAAAQASLSGPLETPPVAAVASAAPAVAALSGLRSLGGDDLPQLLPPDEAFKVSASMNDAQTVRMDYHLTADTYLYRDKLSFVIKAPADIKVTQMNLPPAEVKDDPTFGRTEVYHRDFSATLSLSRALAANEKLVLDATYQGCNDKVGVCYPPITRAFTLALTTSGANASVAASADANAAATAAPESDTSRIERILKDGSFWAVIATFFGLGLLLSLTPCVFPMIPILSGIIAGQKKELTKSSGFLLSLAYVLGMAITYAIVGVVAALSGTLLSNALQNPWALGIGAGIFVLLALSMFGFFEIQLPNFIQSKFSEASNKMQGGNFVGVFIMGALSAVILGPCVAPPLAAALAFIAQTGNMVLGASALFVLALGMGVPLLLIGLSAGALLPKAGGWMNAVKYFFGVLMLAIAIYLISPIIPAWVSMLLWALLMIVSAIYLHALDPLPAHASGWSRLWKGLGVVLLIGGLAILLGMLAGSRDLLQPLAVYQGGARAATGTGATASAADNHALKFERVKSVAELDAKIAASKGREVMLDFYADWCVSCKEMERFTFADPKVQARLKDVVLLQADVTANNADDKALLKRFNLFGPPGIIFWDAEGKQSGYKVIGYEPTEKFLASLKAAWGR